MENFNSSRNLEFTLTRKEQKKFTQNENTSFFRDDVMLPVPKQTAKIQTLQEDKRLLDLIAGIFVSDLLSSNELEPE